LIWNIFFQEATKITLLFYEIFENNQQKLEKKQKKYKLKQKNLKKVKNNILINIYEKQSLVSWYENPYFNECIFYGN
jgi:hypothetical protein